jgi:hypothetical protein
MKKYLIKAAVVMATCVAGITSAMAADSFSGFYLSGGIGQKSAGVEESVSGPGGTGSIKLGDTSFAGQLAGGYSFAFDGGMRLALGGFYDIGDGKAGGGTLTLGGLSATYTVKETRHFGIAIEPGYAFSKDSVAYVKLMYNWITGEETLTGGASGYASSRFNAFGYGVGLKSKISNAAYVYAEWQQAQYGSNTFPSGTSTISYKPNESIGLVGIGMQF